MAHSTGTTNSAHWRNGKGNEMTEYEYVKVQVQDHVALVTMDRPPVNTISMCLSRDLAAALKAIDAAPDEIRAVILTGAQCGATQSASA
jgi:enoyl-CoA hydratase/carnithine racemase